MHNKNQNECIKFPIYKRQPETLMQTCMFLAMKNEIRITAIQSYFASAKYLLLDRRIFLAIYWTKNYLLFERDNRRIFQCAEAKKKICERSRRHKTINVSSSKEYLVWMLVCLILVFILLTFWFIFSVDAMQPLAFKCNCSGCCDCDAIEIIPNTIS